MKTVVRQLLERAGVRVSRSGAANRFDAMSDALRGLSRQGFTPDVIVDAGANAGQWARIACDVFPDAMLHLIEPQAACTAALAGVKAVRRRTEIHAVAVTRPGTRHVRMAAACPGSTGAHVMGEGEGDECEWSAPAATLDELIVDRLLPTDRVLLKLDLEGHELQALEGARRLLPRVEVLLTEVQFYEVERNGLPTFADVATAVGREGFVLADVAGLSARPRDGRLRLGDVIFLRHDSPIRRDDAWA